jgi:hypothetical protein
MTITRMIHAKGKLFIITVLPEGEMGITVLPEGEMGAAIWTDYLI